jgi:hypothetical protein
MRKEQSPLRIYISGPYTAESDAQIIQNVMRTIDVGLTLWKKGHYPYIPHLTHFVDLRAKEKGIKMTWEEYIEWDKAWVEVCDALLFLDNSKGAKKELEYAKKLGKIIYYSTDEVPTFSEQTEGEIYASQSK